MLKPQTSPTRELVSLDGLWMFALDSAETPEPWRGPLQTELEAPVPSSYNDVFADLAIRDHVGWVWYQRTVRVPRGWTNDRIVVRLDAATHEGKVFVGETLVAEHVGGYTPFEADITELVRAGEEFRLTVGVNNELTNETIPPGFITVADDGRRQQKYLHDFYNYAGLARSVWLYSKPLQAIEDITVVPDLDGSTGILRFQVTPSGGSVRVTVRDASGLTVAQQSGAEGEVRIPDARLWKPGAAYLYDFVAEVVSDGDVVDSYTLPVGVRTVEVQGTQILINGEPFHFTGFGKHEDSAVRGKGHDNAYMVHDFMLLKWIGANSFRTSHYPYAEEVMDFADRHGIVVIDETPAVGLNLSIGGGMRIGAAPKTFSPGTMNDATQAAHAQSIRELIARDKNHPSVVMWCITNEPASAEEGAREYFEPLVSLTRELDPSRPVTFANLVFASFDKDRIADLFDVICLNRYYGWYADGGDLKSAEAHLEAELQEWERKFGKPLIMSEYGADTLSGMHSIFEQPWTEEYQVAFLEMYHRVFDRIPAVVGEQVWNFADFQTAGMAFRADGNKKGVFTRDRRPKAAAHALRRRWNKDAAPGS